MSGLLNFLSTPVATNLVIALLHTLWQGFVIAALLFVFLKSKAAQQANLRYAAAVISLLLIVISGLVTWSLVGYQPATSNKEITKATQAAPIADHDSTNQKQTLPKTAITTTLPPVQARSTDSGFINWHTWALFVWLAGVVIMLGRTFYMIVGASRLKCNSSPLEDEKIYSILSDLVAAMKITRHIRIAVTEHILSPGVIGFIQPTLLLPVSMMTGMSAEDIKAVLAHELAHIKRYDCLVNFCQMVIEAILFFNPALWWVSRQIRIEREACCDAATVALTGSRIGYAQLLCEWLHKLSSHSTNTATAAMVGFGDSNDERRMLDRVKRIVVKDHRPKARISWYMTVAMLAAMGVVLFGLWQGTNATVRFAGKLLTPQERIEKIAEIQKSHGQPAYDPDYLSNLSVEEKIKLSGILRTWDGLPLPRSTSITIHSRSGISSSTKSISIDRSEPGHATFSTTANYGTIRISASAEGYAPFVVGPFIFKAGQVMNNIEIIFDKILPADIQLVDADSNQPIVEANIVGGHNISPGGYRHTIILTTDSEGKATLPYVEKIPITISVTAKGYEDTRFEKIMLSKDEPLILKMSKGLETTGIVTSRKTGQPIADAVIYIQEKYSPQGMSYGRDQGDVLATTGKDGRFMITKLNSASKYLLSIKAKGYAYGFLYDVYSGDKDLEAALDDEIIIKGIITGPLDKLTIRKDQTVINYCSGREYDHSSHWDSSKYAPVTITDNVATFEISDLWGNRLRIGTAPNNITLKLDEDIIPDPVVIDLSEKLAENGLPYSKRKVIIEFDTPIDAPPIQGKIRINSFEPGKDYHTGKLIEIVNGRAEAQVVAPGTFSYELADTVGYWFQEKHGVKIESDDEPFIVKVSTVPAGIIFGEVFEHDGKPASNTMVGFREIKKSTLLGDVSFRGVEGKNSSSPDEMETKYSIHPLPLKGKYSVTAYRGNMYVVSKTIELKEKAPIIHLDLVFPQGVTISGKVLTPDGNAASGIGYDLGFKANNGGSFGRSTFFTDALGKFKLEEVNPKADGEYTLQIKSRKDYRPQRIKLKNFDKPLTIKLEHGSVATGRIIEDKTGWPVPGVKLSAYHGGYDDKEYDRVEAEAMTDKNGRFRFSNLKKDCNYKLVPQDCKTTNRMGVEITAGATEELSVKVDIYEWSKLKPKKPDEIE